MELLTEIDKKIVNLYETKIETEKDLAKISKEITDKNLYCINIGPKSTMKFKELIEKTEIGTFFEGFYYEFGLCGKVKDIDRAYKIYEDAANKNKDYLSMYKMYLIHLKEYSKFKIKKDKILEIFYLAKCIRFLPECYFSHGSCIFEYIDPIYCFAYHLDIEDNEVKKFLKLMELLKYSKKYGRLANAGELDLIRLAVGLKLEISESVSKNYLKELEDISRINIDAKYILMMVYTDKNTDGNYEKEVLQTLNELVAKHYYRCYDTCGIYFFNNDYPSYSILKLLTEGKENGNYFCYKCLYDAYTLNLNMDDLELCKNDFLVQFHLLELFELIIKANIMGERYCSYRIYNNTHFLLSKLKYPRELIGDKYGVYLDELTHFIKNINDNPKLCEQFSFSSDQIFDFKRTYCYILTKETYSNLEKNFLLAKKILLENKKNETSIFEKVINVTLLYYIQKKLYKQQKTNEAEFEEVKKDFFKINNEFIETEEPSSVDCYFVAKCYKEGIGTDVNPFLSYCHFIKMGILKPKLYESIVSRYKNSKVKNILKEPFFDEVKRNLEYNLRTNQETCNICMINMQDTLLMPCMHKMCFSCMKGTMKSLDQQSKYALLRCPFCRSNVICYKTYEEITKEVNEINILRGNKGGQNEEENRIEKRIDEDFRNLGIKKDEGNNIENNI